MGRWAPRRRGFSVTVLPAPKLETTTLGCAEPGRESLVRPGTPNEAGARSRSLVRRNDLLCAMNEVSARVTVKRRAVGCWTNRDRRVDRLVAFLCHAMAESANSGLSIQNFSHGCYQVLSSRALSDGRRTEGLNKNNGPLKERMHWNKKSNKDPPRLFPPLFHRSPPLLTVKGLQKQGAFTFGSAPFQNLSRVVLPS